MQSKVEAPIDRWGTLGECTDLMAAALAVWFDVVPASAFFPEGGHLVTMLSRLGECHSAQIAVIMALRVRGRRPACVHTTAACCVECRLALILRSRCPPAGCKLLSCSIGTLYQRWSCRLQQQQGR